jgi:tetratricopeptide (TPR) repeat protein
MEMIRQPSRMAFPFVLALGAFCCSAFAFQPAPSDLAQEARKELFAARYNHAAELYQNLIEADPANADAYYGLVRALLGGHRAKEAFRAADRALQYVPQSPGGLTAAGLSRYRGGDLGQAEKYFQAALKQNPKYSGALFGLASIYSSVSRFKTARELRLEAWRNSPNDSELMLAQANTLRGAEHIGALERVLAVYDPESEEARSLRAHITSDRALGERKTRRLISPYKASRIKLVELMDGPREKRGWGLRMQFNQRQTAKLLLDTGASGISLSAKAAEKAGLEMLTEESTEAKGIGDGRAQASLLYLASEIRAGDVTFADFPISTFRSAGSADFDGLIGVDVFQRFLITLDFVHNEMILEARPDGQAAGDEPEDASPTPADGFYRALRFGNHLTIATSINQQAPRLFLIDSGSTANLVDADIARESTKVRRDDLTTVEGVQGKVDHTSRADKLSLVFAGFRQDNSNLIAINFDKTNDSMGVGLAGILGMPVLRLLKLTIDYRNGTVRFDHEREP